MADMTQGSDMHTERPISMQIGSDMHRRAPDLHRKGGLTDGLA